MQNTAEYGLMIIWEKARNKEREIIEDLKNRFVVRNIIYTTWNKALFSQNLTRFYGQNLPKNSFKEQHCGNGTFTVLILIDNNPIYAWRPTSHGKEYVNVNFFDSKEMYRHQTGQHRIHCTNNEVEFRHDLMMLFGRNTSDFIKEFKEGQTLNFDRDTVGTKGWDSFEQLFYVLNETCEYVVLRNYQNLPENAQYGKHSDVDILCQNSYNMSTILNAKPVHKSRFRAKYIVIIADSYINVDLRCPGDNYYDSKWACEILKTRVKNKCFFIPNNENLKYSLLYHALIQKKNVDEQYTMFFNETFGNSADLKQLFDLLKRYMNERNYKFIPARDYSVYFNSSLCHEKPNWRQIVYYALFPFVRVLSKINSKLLHR